MKLGLVIPGYQADASDWCIPAFTNLAHELAKSVDLHVFALRYPGARRDYTIGQIHVHATGGGALLGKRVVGASLLKLWRDALADIEREHAKARFDAVMGVWATESGWLATVAAERLGVRSLVHVAGGELVWLPSIRYGNQRRGLARLLVRRCLRNADLLTVPSGPMEQALLQYPGVKPGKVRRWALGVDMQMFRPCEDGQASKADPFTFITIGSLVPVKGHAWLIEGAGALARANPGRAFRLQIVGDGPLLPELRSLVRSSGLEGYVSFLGDVAHEQLPALLRIADCFLLGSRHEAQCMAALEAMSCGIAWIAPRVGALADCALPAPGEPPCGISVKDRNVESLANAMSQMLNTSPEERAAWGEAARRRVAAEYELQTQTARLLGLMTA